MTGWTPRTCQRLLALGRQLGHGLATHSLRLGVAHERVPQSVQQSIGPAADPCVNVALVHLPAGMHLRHYCNPKHGPDTIPHPCMRNFHQWLCPCRDCRLQGSRSRAPSFGFMAEPIATGAKAAHAVGKLAHASLRWNRDRAHKIVEVGLVAEGFHPQKSELPCEVLDICGDRRPRAASPARYAYLFQNAGIQEHGKHFTAYACIHPSEEGMQYVLLQGFGTTATGLSMGTSLASEPDLSCCTARCVLTANCTSHTSQSYLLSAWRAQHACDCPAPPALIVWLSCRANSNN